MRIERMLVDLSRLRELESLPECGGDFGKHGFALSDYLRIELTDRADGLPACIADDLTVFGCIIGHSELVGGSAIRALKVDLSDGNFVLGHVTDSQLIDSAKSP